jgi:hypothetical protein
MVVVIETAIAVAIDHRDVARAELDPVRGREAELGFLEGRVARLGAPHGLVGFTSAARLFR